MPTPSDLRPSDLKSILHSKRANLYYLEHCRVLVKGGRVEYVTDAGKESLYWNIPIANTTSVLLGTGTSITQAAVRELAKAGVLLAMFRHLLLHTVATQPTGAATQLGQVGALPTGVVSTGDLKAPCRHFDQAGP